MFTTYNFNVKKTTPYLMFLRSVLCFAALLSLVFTQQLIAEEEKADEIDQAIIDRATDPQMTYYRKAAVEVAATRDANTKKLLETQRNIEIRKDEILVENEDAGELRDAIIALQKEIEEKREELDQIYKEDEKLAELHVQEKEMRLAVQRSQDELREKIREQHAERREIMRFMQEKEKAAEAEKAAKAEQQGDD